MKKYILIGSMILITLLVINSFKYDEKTREISIDSWKEDISYLDETLKETHPDLFRNISEKEWNKDISSLKKDINKLSDTEILLRLSDIISNIEEGHTLLPMNEALTPLNNSDNGNILSFPIIIEEFKDGYRVVKSDKEYKNILGYKLISINNTKIDDVLTKVGNIMSADNEQGEKSKSIMCFNSLDILKFLEIIDSETASFEFETDKKEKVIIKINSKKIKDIEFISIERKSYITEKRTEGIDKFYWFENFKDDNILYFQYNQCISNNTMFINEAERNRLPSFSQFIQSLIDEINNNEFDKFIIDLRYNTGGSIGLTQALLSSLENRTNIEDKDIYVLIGKNTFSAGVVSAYLINECLDVTTVGEETGGNINLFTTLPDKDIIELPNSKKKVLHPSDFTNYTSDEVKGVKADIEIIQSFENYTSGIDDLYEYVRMN